VLIVCELRQYLHYHGGRLISRGGSTGKAMRPTNFPFHILLTSSLERLSGRTYVYGLVVCTFASTADEVEDEVAMAIVVL